MKNAFIILIALLFASCADNGLETSPDSVAYFERHLKTDMNYESLKHTFGEPDNDIGSGIHIYLYNLQDGTKIQIGFVDSIIYARHVDANDQLIEDLL